MNTYTYQLPLVKGSKKTIHILNAKKEHVYTMKQTYKSIFHEFFDFWIGELQLLCAFDGRDQEGKVVVQSKKKHYLTKRSDSILIMESDSYRAKMEDGDAITPTYKIEGTNVQMKVTIDFNRLVKFYENGSVIAKIQLHFSKNKESELVIDELATIQQPLFYTIFAQMFYFVGEF